MELDEFLSDMEKFLEMEKKSKELFEIFLAKLRVELILITYKHMPNLEEIKTKVEPKLYEIADRLIKKILDEYDYILSLQTNNQEVTYYRIKKPQTKEEAELELQKELIECPEEHRELWAEIFWETYAEELDDQIFVYTIHTKIKEIFVEFYLEDILLLDSKYLLRLDWDLGLIASDFVSEIYDLDLT